MSEPMPDMPPASWRTRVRDGLLALIEAGAQPDIKRLVRDHLRPNLLVDDALAAWEFAAIQVGMQAVQRPTRGNRRGVPDGDGGRLYQPLPGMSYAELVAMGVVKIRLEHGIHAKLIKDFETWVTANPGAGLTVADIVAEVEQQAITGP